MLSEARGPLAKLLENLSSEHGEYWLAALKKMLRKEKLPEAPAEVLKLIETPDFRSAPLQRIQAIAEYLREIPTVNFAHVVDDEERDLLSIGVYPNVTDFLRKIKDQDDASFWLQANGTVKYHGVEEKDADATFDEWCKKYFNENDTMTLKDFCDAVMNLGEMYEKAILQIEVQ